MYQCLQHSFSPEDNSYVVVAALFMPNWGDTKLTGSKHWLAGRSKKLEVVNDIVYVSPGCFTTLRKTFLSLTGMLSKISSSETPIDQSVLYDSGFQPSRYDDPL